MTNVSANKNLLFIDKIFQNTHDITKCYIKLDGELSLQNRLYNDNDGSLFSCNGMLFYLKNKQININNIQVMYNYDENKYVVKQHKINSVDITDNVIKLERIFSYNIIKLLDISIIFNPIQDDPPHYKVSLKTLERRQ